MMESSGYWICQKSLDIYNGVKLQCKRKYSSLKERPCVSQAAGLEEQGYVNLLEYPRCYHKPQMLDVDLQILVFAGFWSYFDLIFPYYAPILPF